MDFNVGDKFIDNKGVVFQLTMVGATFYRKAYFKDNNPDKEMISVYINERLGELIWDVANNKVIPYTKASWLLYGKTKKV